MRSRSKWLSGKGGRGSRRAAIYPEKEGEAPAEPRSRKIFGDSGSAGASPSLECTRFRIASKSASDDGLRRRMLARMGLLALGSAKYSLGVNAPANRADSNEDRGASCARLASRGRARTMASISTTHSAVLPSQVPHRDPVPTPVGPLAHRPNLRNPWFAPHAE